MVSDLENFSPVPDCEPDENCNFKQIPSNELTTNNKLITNDKNRYEGYKNNFMCLPEILKKMGYRTSWVFGSDSNFDGQASFLKKIGFEKIIDKFDFKNPTSSLGWWLSDKDLFLKLENVLDNERQPFFSSTLTSMALSLFTFSL